MRRNWIQITLIVCLILLPVTIWRWFNPPLPDEITIAMGPGKGLYQRIMGSLEARIKKISNAPTVNTVPTKGSVENLRLLQEGLVDFAIYQSGTEEFLGGPKRLFNLLDGGPDGQLTPEEFQHDRDPENAARDFAELDADKNGSLSRGEFEHQPGVSGPKTLFDLLDVYGDGQLTPLEFQHGRNPKKAATAFKDLDKSPKTGSLSRGEFKDTPGVIRFVANLHSDVAHFIVPADSKIKSLDGLKPEHRVSFGSKLSGDYAVSQILQLEGPAESLELSYPQIREFLLNGKLDGAFIMAGITANILDDLLGEGECKVLDIPHAKALARRNVLVSEYTIPKAFYRSGPKPVPARDVSTIALRAQLLTREDVNETIVKEVTEIVLSNDSMKDNHLKELFEDEGFATKNPEFPIHPAAEKVYDPRLHPFLDPGFVESTDGIRQFVVSFIIAAFFGFRWLKKKKARQNEHRLDRHIRELLGIERRQVALDRGLDRDDTETLQGLLDEVTFLRQEALGEFSAHELNEDGGVACFINMSHELTQKINAKLTRQRLDRTFADLASSLREEKAPTAGKTQSKPAGRSKKKKKKK